MTSRSAAYNFVEQGRSTTILLSRRRGMMLLNAMAEAAGLADYMPGRAEIPLPLEAMLGETFAAGLRENRVKKG